jgi:integrase
VSFDSLVNQASVLIGMARAESTNKRYSDVWKEFCSFASWAQQVALPASEDLILAFLAWYELSGRAASVKVVKSAIRAAHVDKRLLDPTTSVSIKAAIDGTLRHAAREKLDEGGSVRKRDPFPVSALQHWMRHRPVGISYFIWIRNAALVAVGMRCMRRPNELCKLRWKHIAERDGCLVISIIKSKTDQLGAGKEIPVEFGEGLMAPSWLLWSLKQGSRWTAGDDWVFCSQGGKQLSVSAVSSIVQKMVEWAGIQGWYTGYSLRIGGATAAMSGGLTLEQIMAVGGWKSGVVLLYLRALGAAQANASARMGLC